MIIINNEKAIEIAKDRIREWRESEFKRNDVDLQNALADGADTTLYIARRNYLRDVTEQFNNKTVEELKEALALAISEYAKIKGIGV
jgi:hypothetical protein